MARAAVAEHWRLGRRLAVDGLRGVAVLLVLVCHVVDRDRLLGLGSAGVTLFFVLSGFLITSLLLEEHERGGRVDLRRFYWRRALRLLPALVLVAGLSPNGLVVYLWLPTIVAVLGAAAVLWLAQGTAPCWATSRPLVLLGQRSYGIYLWNGPAYYLVDAFGVARVLAVPLICA